MLTQYDAAEAAFQRAITLAPGAAVLCDHGELLALTQRHALAIEAYQAALRHEPGNAATYNCLGLSFQASGPLEKWQTSRALGELSGVPRGRTPIGLRLTGGRFVQAWARNSDALRGELVRLVEARQP